MSEHDKAIGETLADEKTLRQTDVCCILQISKMPNGTEAVQAKRKSEKSIQRKKRTNNETKMS